MIRILVLLSCALMACSSSSGRPVLPSSANQSAYALRYNDSLVAATKAVGSDEVEAKQLIAGIKIDDLKKTDWDKIGAIVDKADESGRSAGYAEAHAEWTAARTFWNEERENISAKVSGNAQYAGKQAGCTADVGGAAAFALKESVDKTLDKRLRAHNEAFVLIERHQTALGKENIPAIEKLADDVARASWLVHVDLYDQRERLKARVAEKGTIATTLDGYIREEQAHLAHATEKKPIEDRITLASRARRDVDRTTAEAEEMLKNIDKRIEEANKQYEEALKALKAKIAQKKGSLA
jgi:phosphopantetheinyl transferase (holo-ACP synthase)